MATPMIDFAFRKKLVAEYREREPRIRNAWPRTISPYFVDWLPIFTHIEVDAWNAIRRLGLPFYPQYPVGRRFVDFGDPVTGLAIECDGAAWHDKVRDAERDAELADLGWTVKRFTGRQCVLPEDHPDSIDAYLAALRRAHYWQDA